MLIKRKGRNIVAEKQKSSTEDKIPPPDPVANDSKSSGDTGATKPAKKLQNDKLKCKKQRKVINQNALQKMGH